MNEKVLNAIFGSYVDDVFTNFQATTFSDLKNEMESLEGFEEAHGFTVDEQNDLRDIVFDMTYICERKSFINGLKLGTRMVLELLNNGQARNSPENPL